MFSSKDKILEDLAIVKDVTDETVAKEKVPSPKMRGAFMRLYQSILDPDRFVKGCDLEDPLGEKVLSLEKAKVRYQTTKMRHQETNQIMGMFVTDLSRILSNSLSYESIFPRITREDAGSTKDYFAHNREAQNEFIYQEQIEPVVAVDAFFLSLDIRRAIMSVFVPFSEEQYSMLSRLSSKWRTRKEEDFMGNIKTLFPTLQSVYADLPWKTVVLDELLEMLEMSDEEADQESFMIEFVRAFHEMIKRPPL